MIYAEQLTYGFADRDLYRDISFTLPENRHCVLIGSNGSGKTTLVDLIRAPEKFLFDGSLRRENIGRIGFMVIIITSILVQAMKTTTNSGARLSGRR